MVVILTVQTDALLPPHMQRAFDAYFGQAKSKAEVADELGLDYQTVNHIMADLFAKALERSDAAAHIEIRP